MQKAVKQGHHRAKLHKATYSIQYEHVDHTITITM